MIFRYLFVFFKQKTAYEMRISDWRSDACSSDLGPCPAHQVFGDPAILLYIKLQPEFSRGFASDLFEQGIGSGGQGERQAGRVCGACQVQVGLRPEQTEIGRASWRERVCKYV